MNIIALILAGGKSTRMGQDKAVMMGGVARLQELLVNAGVERVVVLCGDAHRKVMFDGEVVPDPSDVAGVHRLLAWAHSAFPGPKLLVPCDAFLLNSRAIEALLPHTETGGVPLDEKGQRQPLFALIPERQRWERSPPHVRAMMQELPSINMGEFARCFTNFNTPDDLLEHRLQDHVL
jgi:molybdopterin-guanine dinucleotide biosynthesis protein A